jgi:hypothetical protein
MKKLIGYLITISILLSQDMLTTKTGKIYEGELVSYLTKTVLIIKDGAQYSLPINSVESLVLEDGTVLIKENKIVLEIDFKKQREEKRKIQEACEKNKNTKLLLIPLKDDYYGYSDNALTFFDSVCFIIIDPTLALEYFISNSIEPEDINDYHLKKVAEELGADLVMYGYAYRYEVPYKYSPTTSDPLAVTTLFESQYDNTWNNLFNALGRSLVVGSQQLKREQAITAAGTYVNVTLYAINILTGKKKYFLQNTTVLKVG